jgi:uncharacterized protein
VRADFIAGFRERFDAEPGSYLPYISPTPLLMLVAAGDHLVPSELAIAAFEDRPARRRRLPHGRAARL